MPRLPSRLTALQHLAEAQDSIHEAGKDDVALGSDQERWLLGRAQTHALIAQAMYLREIGDQLDTFPRHAPAQSSTTQGEPSQ